MKDFHAGDSTEPQIENDLSFSKNDVMTLQLRQERILRQLEELKLQLQSIRKNNQNPSSNVSSSAASSTVSSTKTTIGKSLKPDKLQDIVIAASPQHPPFSLPVLLNMLREHVKVGTNVHVHSSVTADTTKLPVLKFFERSNGSRSEVQMMITLIWKNVDGIDPVMIIDPTVHSAIKGEVNIARYFFRLLGRYGEAPESTLVDHLLDTIHASILYGNNKEMQSVVRQLNAKLGKNKWLASQDAPTVADAVAWSFFQRSDLAAGSSANVAKWLANCDSHKFFHDART